MLKLIRRINRLLQNKKYGKPLILVSGLPRSGTSMMMKMLDAGGVSIMTDKIRKADEDNPKGYYEYERVKELDKPGHSKEWLKEARGKAIKIISFLLPELPEENHYKIIFMRRDLEEVLASQNKMLVHRKEDGKKKVDDETMKGLYEKHLRKLEVTYFEKPNVDVLNLNYREALRNPSETAESIKNFLDMPLNTDEMVKVVDHTLYRNRTPR